MQDKAKKTSISLFTASVITTLSITLVLFLLGLTLLIGFTAKALGSYLKESLAISIELTDSVDNAEIAQMQKDLNANKYIKSAVFISKEEVKKQLIEDLGRDPEEIIGYDPSHSYFDIFVKSEYVNPDSMKMVEQSLKGKTLVKNIIYNQDDIINANSNLSLVGTVLLVLAIILVLISFTLIRSIIQLNIYSKRFLINTMQLVGATNSFIRKPFMNNMIVCGIIAAIFANAGVTGIVYYITSAFPETISIIKMDEMMIIYVLVLFLGVFIALWATISSVNRYLKMTTNKLYRV